MKKYDLSWGDPKAVRDAFFQNNDYPVIDLSWEEITNLGYPAFEGDLEVLQLTKDLIKRQTGLDYKYVLLTNGATGGLNIVLRAYAQKGYNKCFTMSAPFFPLYPSIISNANLELVNTDFRDEKDVPVALINSPSNPLGHMPNISKNALNMPVIWDAVYANNVYTQGLTLNTVEHEVVVGSYSKLTGLAGLRLGWIATNDDLLYERLKDLTISEYAGLSIPSAIFLLNLNNGIYWDIFEKAARYKLDCNREEWSKVTRFFGEKEVSPVGMFYYSEIDSSCKKLMEKANISHMPGSKCGTDDDFGRFNLGASNEVIRDAVKAILKEDKIKLC